ncbi:hypothetical protein M0R45_014969 [Rubus argutus]|uniref:Transmembrane protein n=1 Tax=Rubus argutus TaxID=59490 RepID=A0AAW1XPG2_RUBAR
MGRLLLLFKSRWWRGAAVVIDGSVIGGFGCGLRGLVCAIGGDLVNMKMKVDGNCEIACLEVHRQRRHGGFVAVIGIGWVGLCGWFELLVAVRLKLVLLWWFHGVLMSELGRGQFRENQGWWLGLPWWLCEVVKWW